MIDIRFYLDFVSPYAWLALMKAREFAGQHDVRWELRPIVYAKILDATGLVGPAENPAKRRYTFRDVARCAAWSGLGLQGPPAHPFRSLEAARTLVAFEDAPQVLDLAVSLADAAWGEGLDLTEPAVLRGCVERVGLDGRGLPDRISRAEVKDRLRAHTDTAIAAGVFGVPTFELDGELFWGHDRMAPLADRIHGALRDSELAAEQILERPVGARRTRSPHGAS